MKRAIEESFPIVEINRLAVAIRSPEVTRRPSCAGNHANCPASASFALEAPGFRCFNGSQVGQMPADVTADCVPTIPICRVIEGHPEHRLNPECEKTRHEHANSPTKSRPKRNRGTIPGSGGGRQEIVQIHRLACLLEPRGRTSRPGSRCLCGSACEIPTGIQQLRAPVAYFPDQIHVSFHRFILRAGGSRR